MLRLHDHIFIQKFHNDQFPFKYFIPNLIFLKFILRTQFSMTNFCLFSFTFGDNIFFFNFIFSTFYIFFSILRIFLVLLFLNAHFLDGSIEYFLTILYR